MKAASLILALFAAIACAQDDGHGKTSDKFHDLTQDSFERLVADAKGKLVGGSWLIAFYAPWCGHCKRLMPVLDSFAEEFGDGSRLSVGRVNCDESENKQLCTSYDVSGYPTVVFLNGEYFYEFNKQRTSEQLKKFIFDGEYENAESERIPLKLEGLALYQKQAQKFLSQVGRSLEILFAKLGFPDAPKPLMYGIAGSFFALPIALMCYVICFMKDEPYEPPKRKEEEEKKKPASASRSKSEKLE